MGSRNRTMAPESSAYPVGSLKAALLDRLNNRTARIGIIGLGYVGLPLMLRFSEVGYRVTGFDIDEKKVTRLKVGSDVFLVFSPEREDPSNPDYETKTIPRSAAARRQHVSRRALRFMARQSSASCP